MADRYIRRGKPVPDSLIGPDVLPGYEDWYRAFHELSTDRQIGMAVGPIPAAAIDRHGGGAFFRRVIRAMDRVYLAHVRGDVDAPESENLARDSFRAAMKGPTK